MRRNQLVAVLFASAIVLSLVALIVVLANPFRTLPSVKVVDAKWELTSAGYALNLDVETTGRLQLVAVDVGGTVWRVTRDIVPPQTNATIFLPVKSPERTVTLHFDVLGPMKVSAKTREYDLKVDFATGATKLFIVGTVPSNATVIYTRTPSELSIAVFLYMWYYIRQRELFTTSAPFANITYIMIPGNEVSSVIERHRTLVFVDVAPEPELLQSLLKMGKNVVLSFFNDEPGRLRMRVINGTAEVYKVEGDNPEVDYFGVYCVREHYTTNLVHGFTFLRALSWLGSLSGKYAVMESPHYRLFQEAHMKNEFGDVYLGRTVRGFYYASISIPHLAVLVASGFFDTGERLSYEVRSIAPFKGVRVLNLPVYSSGVVSIVVEGAGTIQRFVSPPPVQHSIKGDAVVLSIGVDRYGRRVWNGTLPVAVHEVTYDGMLVDVHVDSTMSLPTVLEVRRSPFTALLLFVGGRLVSVVGDEAVFEPVRVYISNSEICEAFYLSIRREDSVNTPLFLYINGRRTALLDPKQSFDLSECTPGYYLIEVRNIYGDLVASRSFRATRIYEQPMFIITSLMGVAVVSMGYMAIKKRAVKEVDNVTLVFYRLPERAEPMVGVEGLVEVINKIYVRKKISPTVKEVVEHVYRRRPVMKAVAEVFEIFRRLPSSAKEFSIYSRYVPEVDDTITLVGKGSLRSVVADFYTYVVLEVMKKMGGTPVPKEYTKDVVDVDGAILLGNSLLLLTYAPCITKPDKDIRDALDRAFSAFMLIRRLKLPFRPIGFAVLTEPKYVGIINRQIDDILSGNREVAARVLRDMSVFQRISEASRDAWIGRYVMIAAPITRIAPLFAFVKVRAPKLCNHYYRFARFAEQG